MKCAITFIHNKLPLFFPCAIGLHYLLSLHYYLQQSRQNIKTLYREYQTLSLLAVLPSRGYTSSTKALQVDEVIQRHYALTLLYVHTSPLAGFSLQPAGSEEEGSTKESNDFTFTKKAHPGLCILHSYRKKNK